MERIFWSLLFAGACGPCVFAQPDWASLDRYQQTVTAETFSRLVSDLYSPDGGLVPYLSFIENGVAIFPDEHHTGSPLFALRFAGQDAPHDMKKPQSGAGALAGLRIALDPGHIGGAWSRMEERFFLMDREKDWPVQEAALNLHVARLLRDRLVAAGATVELVKDDFEPLTSTRPDPILEAGTNLPPPDPRFAHLPEIFAMSSQRDATRKKAEQQFYRTDEINARAQKVNLVIKPDLTLCIHFNATGYGDEKKLYEENGLAFFVHGNYLAAELREDAQKFFLMRKLLERNHETELGLAESISAAFAGATGLPPAYEVGSGGVMHPVGTHAYIYARNLAANRQYQGPVVFLEPYFMNNRVVYQRIQAGDYEGMQHFDGRAYPSIFREYADAVAAGIVNFYGKL